MAPTVCNKKEPHVRGSAAPVIVRDSSKLLKNSTSGSASTSAVSNAGKIIHRRSVTVRSARSKLSARRLPDSESSSSEESDIEDYSRLKMANSSSQSPSPTKYDEPFPSAVAVIATSPSHPASVDDITMELPESPASILSDASTGCQCSDRLTSLTGSSTTTTDSAYDSNRCRHCRSSPNSSRTSPAFVADAAAICNDDTLDVKPSISNDLVLFNPIRNELSDDCTSDYSTHSSAWCSDECGSSNLDNSRYYVSKKTPKNNRALLEIAVKTVKLIKRNQLLQQKLTQLQFETRQFFESVMSNPENQNINMKINSDERTKIEA